ncbi:hypothetical protein [Peptostreptococcus equinus]|uniref:Membrane protein YkvI n=1 Tax=Peptostreptococcus equinus TaxID=3003601 RepID=A0ABY7JR79_9FIRM|nr:hypothetical protein [Peptostreptococcus sp. CBA3647]WAW14678.1 hypothetical protein O0R46_08755 [Peptostreptococcus sp. CBA3647]
MKKAKRVGSLGAIFGVASVLFGSHAGGGFATGNQETQFYVQYGWTAPLTAILAMLLLTFTMREMIVFYNNNDCKNYKELFTKLWDPYPKLEILWEIYYYLMVIIAVSAVIAGAAAVFKTMGVPYLVAVLLVGFVLLILTIYGALVVSSAAGIMSIIILVCCLLIFLTGINLRSPEISKILTNREFWGANKLTPFILVFTYAGFQSVVIPSLAAASRELICNEKEATWSMVLSFIMNAIALGLAVTMLLGWFSEFKAAGQMTLPTLFVAKHTGSTAIAVAYQVSLLLCLISTGVTCIYGLVNRFEDYKKLMWLKTRQKRRIFTACAIMIVAILLSLTGLSNIVKYGYGYCGYLGIFAIIVPFLTIGIYKNRKFKKENPDYKWHAQRVRDGEDQAGE